MILPCRDASETLGVAVESILAQSFGNFELLVWDDGSTDGSGDLLRTICTGDSRLRVVGEKRVGLVSALQQLSSAAQGALLARMDADDVSRPLRFEKQVGYLDAHPKTALVGCKYASFGEAPGSGRSRYDDWMNSLVSDEEIARDLFVECPLAHPSFMMRRNIFEAVGGYADDGWAEDYDLLMRFRLEGHGIGKVGEVLLDWRHDSARTSLRDARYSEANFRALKRHYLFRMYPEEMRGFYQWGAGEVGKRWLREWPEVPPEAVVDVNPRKIGERIHGTQVIEAESLPGPGKGFVVVAVGAPGARKDIRGWFAPRGYVELRDYVFVA